MALEFKLETAEQATPELKGSYRIGVGASIVLDLLIPGSVAVKLMRGSGTNPVETFPVEIRQRTFGPFQLDGERVTLPLATLDLFLPDASPRRYQVVVNAIGSTVFRVPAGLSMIATEPSAQAGVGPPNVIP